MIKRLFLYFSVVFVVVVFATAANRYFLEKKKTVTDVFEETSNFLGRTVAQEKSLSKAPLNKESVVEDPKFKNWFQEEAAQLYSTSVDLKAKEKELSEVAKSLDDRKIQYLQKTPLNPKASQSERMLSIYMLTLGGAVAQKALVDIASQDLNLNPAEPHSTDEIQNNQLRASQIVAIDAIAEGQRELSSRIDDLQKIISKTNDVFIKNYAQRKQDELRMQ